MKGLKLVAVTMLTVGAAFGSVIERAEAQFINTGNIATGNRTDATSLDYRFTLFPVVEDRDADNIRGFFQNAITDFTGEFNDVDDLFAFDFLDIKEPLTLNLRANLRESDGAIEYILRGDQLRSRGINGLALIIDGLTGNPFLDTLAKRELAVNDLGYIINNGLLGLVNQMRVTGLSSDGSGRIVGSSNEENEVTANVEFIRPIPESNPNNSLLALGALGVGLGVKRRFQTK